MLTNLAIRHAQGQEQDHRHTSEVGIDYHLTKPTDPNMLETLLAQFATEPG